MMKRRLIYLMLPLMAWGLALTSCIRDEIAECPPMRITVSVKDKNYFNVDEVAAKGLIEKMDEDLPFRDYVRTLYYVIHDEAGNVVLEQTNREVDNDDREQVIDLPASLPYGKYRVTVWGNMKSDRPLGDDPATAELEHTDAAQNDIYLADYELDYRLGSEHHTVALERTKGRLIITAEGLPDYIDFSEKTVHDIYSIINSSFEYSELVNLTSQTEWTQPNEMMTHTLLGPSREYEKSKLEVDFYDRSTLSRSVRMLTPDDIQITMGRNELTVVKYIFVEQGGEEPDPDDPDPDDPDPDDPDPDDPDPDDPDDPDPDDPDPDDPDPDEPDNPDPDKPVEGKFYIYVLVNDNWEMVHKMEID